MSDEMAYDVKIAEDICDTIASSNKGLHSICEEKGYKYRTIRRWIRENPEFSRMYDEAKQDQADFLAEEIIDISDDSSQDVDRIDEYGNKIENKEFVNRSKLKVDARKWIASKLKPKKYGDKLEVEQKITTINAPSWLEETIPPVERPDQ